MHVFHELKSAQKGDEFTGGGINIYHGKSVLYSDKIIN